METFTIQQRKRQGVSFATTKTRHKDRVEFVTVQKQQLQKAVLMIPCYNEEQGLPRILESIPKQRLRQMGIDLHVIVIDNNSKDRTALVARRMGARVIKETKQGKGYAIKRGFRSIPRDADYVVMIDGDNTYKVHELPRMLEPLQSGFADVVIGSRLTGRMNVKSMTLFNRTGNWFFTFLVRYFVHSNVTDVLTGYFAWKRDVIKDLEPHLESKDFSIEMEMIIKMAKLKHSITSVPITYEDRLGESKLRPVRDGMSILSVFLKNARWKP